MIASYLLEDYVTELFTKYSIRLKKLLEEFYEFLLAHYAIVKFHTSHVIKPHEIGFLNFICHHLPIATITAILMLTVFLPVFIVLSSYQTLVRLILLLRIGNKFLGFINGCNSVVLIDEKTASNFCINIVMIIQTKEIACDLFAQIKERVWSKVSANALLFSVRDTFLGYHYLKGVNDVYPSEVFEEVNLGKTVITQDKFIDVLNGSYMKTSLPRNNKFNWKLLFLSTPIETTVENEKKFVIIFKIHHALVDWLSFYNLFSDIFCKQDKSKCIYGEYLYKSLKDRSIYKRTTFIKSSPKISEHNNFLARRISNDNDLNTMYAEKNDEYFVKINNIRLRCKESSFLSIFLTALSASLTEYFIKNTLEVPKDVSVLSPQQVNPKRFKDYFSNHSANKLGNDFAGVIYKLPINFEGTGNCDIKKSILRRLDYVNQDLERLADSFDAKVSYIISNTYFKVLPYPIYHYLCKSFNVTVGLSSLPGGPKLRFFNGDAMDILMGFIPRQCCGLYMAVVTYDNRFNIAINSDKSKFGDERNLNTIIQRLLYYLDVLDSKTRRSEPSET